MTIELADLIFKIIAAVAAGVWALFLLVTLRQPARAQAELRKTEEEIREIELRAKRQAVVAVDIKATILSSPDGEGHIILAVVELTNRGSRNTRIKWKDQLPAFYVRLTQFDPSGRPTYLQEKELRVPQTLNPDVEARSHVIRTGGTESIPFAVKVSLPGIYLLSFRGAVDDAELQQSKELGVELPGAWTANKHVVVGADAASNG